MLRWYCLRIFAAFIAMLQSRATLTHTVVDAQQAKIDKKEKTIIRIAFAGDIGPFELSSYTNNISYFKGSEFPISETSSV